MSLKKDKIISITTKPGGTIYGIGASGRLYALTWSGGKHYWIEEDVEQPIYREKIEPGVRRRQARPPR